MKKTLCVLLALLMLLGSFSVGVSALEINLGTIEANSEAMAHFTVKGLPEKFNCSIEEFKTYENGKYWNEINLIGMDLDFLYTNINPLVWSYLDVFHKNPDGTYIYDETGEVKTKITQGEIALTFSTINKYLSNIYYNVYGGLNPYNSENAVALANIIGKVFYRDFKELDVNNFNDYFGSKIPNSQEFFEAVVTLSRLDVLVQNNWCSRGREFCEPVVKILGGTYVEFFNEYYSNGKVLAARILEGMHEKAKIEGPVKVILDIVKAYSVSYNLVYREPTLALFTHKLERVQNVGSVEEYQTVSGLLKLIFCNCDPMEKEGCFASKPTDVDHFCPLEFPAARIATSENDEDLLMYLYYYFNLCSAYRGNSDYFANVKKNIRNSSKISDSDKTKLESVVDGYFLNNINSTVDNLVTPYLNENLVPDSTNFFTRLKNSLMSLMKKMADYFDYWLKILSGELDYGQGGSPFI